MPEWRVIWVHAMRNIAGAADHRGRAQSYAYLLEGSVLTETIFAWPGLGSYITDALFDADMTAVLGGTVVVGVVFIDAQHAVGHALPAGRPEGARMTALRAWLQRPEPRLAPAGAAGAGLARPGCAFAATRWRWSGWSSSLR